jgi:hypothetical protein
MTNLHKRSRLRQQKWIYVTLTILLSASAVLTIGRKSVTFCQLAESPSDALPTIVLFAKWQYVIDISANCKKSAMETYGLLKLILFLYLHPHTHPHPQTHHYIHPHPHPHTPLTLNNNKDSF